VYVGNKQVLDRMVNLESKYESAKKNANNELSLNKNLDSVKVFELETKIEINNLYSNILEKLINLEKKKTFAQSGGTKRKKKNTKFNKTHKKRF
jgi:hypothetical protein